MMHSFENRWYEEGLSWKNTLSSLSSFIWVTVLGILLTTWFPTEAKSSTSQFPIGMRAKQFSQDFTQLSAEQLNGKALQFFQEWDKRLESCGLHLDGKNPEAAAEFIASLYDSKAAFFPTMQAFWVWREYAEKYMEHFCQKNPLGKVISSKTEALWPNAFVFSWTYIFTLPEQKWVEAEFTYVLERNVNGELSITHHHSSTKTPLEWAGQSYTPNEQNILPKTEWVLTDLWDVVNSAVIKKEGYEIDAHIVKGKNEKGEVIYTRISRIFKRNSQWELIHVHTHTSPVPLEKKTEHK